MEILAIQTRRSDESPEMDIEKWDELSRILEQVNNDGSSRG